MDSIRMNREQLAQTRQQPGALGACSEMIIRAARPEDAKSGAELIYLPMGKLADYLFGFDDAARAKEVLAILFAQEENRFSHQFSDVLEADGQVVGILLGFPGTTLKNTELPMARQLRALYGWRGMFRFLRRAVPLMRFKETEPDDFYIFTLAIQPEFQSSGLGASLLAQAEAKALKFGLEKASLGVAVDNEPAVHFYKEHEF